MTAGMLRDRLVVIVWTWRGKVRRIISMRYAHEKECKLWQKRMG
ncbi:BrnT family toxin [Aristophania vespae]|nr:BrnT family toxin [Aristophania vespae]